MPALTSQAHSVSPKTKQTHRDIDINHAIDPVDEEHPCTLKVLFVGLLPRHVQHSGLALLLEHVDNLSAGVQSKEKNESTKLGAVSKGDSIGKRLAYEVEFKSHIHRRKALNCQAFNRSIRAGVKVADTKTHK